MLGSSSKAAAKELARATRGRAGGGRLKKVSAVKDRVSLARQYSSGPSTTAPDRPHGPSAGSSEAAAAPPLQQASSSNSPAPPPPAEDDMDYPLAMTDSLDRVAAVVREWPMEQKYPHAPRPIDSAEDPSNAFLGDADVAVASSTGGFDASQSALQDRRHDVPGARVEVDHVPPHWLSRARAKLDVAASADDGMLAYADDGVAQASAAKAQRKGRHLTQLDLEGLPQDDIEPRDKRLGHIDPAPALNRAPSTSASAASLGQPAAPSAHSHTAHHDVLVAPPRPAAADRSSVGATSTKTSTPPPPAKVSPLPWPAVERLPFSKAPFVSPTDSKVVGSAATRAARSPKVVKASVVKAPAIVPRGSRSVQRPRPVSSLSSTPPPISLFALLSPSTRAAPPTSAPVPSPPSPASSSRLALSRQEADDPPLTRPDVEAASTWVPPLVVPAPSRKSEPAAEVVAATSVVKAPAIVPSGVRSYKRPKRVSSPTSPPPPLPMQTAGPFAVPKAASGPVKPSLPPLADVIAPLKLPARSKKKEGAAAKGKVAVRAPLASAPTLRPAPPPPLSALGPATPRLASAKRPLSPPSSPRSQALHGLKAPLKKEGRAAAKGKAAVRATLASAPAGPPAPPPLPSALAPAMLRLASAKRPPAPLSSPRPLAAFPRPPLTPAARLSGLERTLNPLAQVQETLDWLRRATDAFRLLDVAPAASASPSVLAQEHRSEELMDVLLPPQAGMSSGSYVPSPRPQNVSARNNLLDIYDERAPGPLVPLSLDDSGYYGMPGRRRFMLLLPLFRPTYFTPTPEVHEALLGYDGIRASHSVAIENFERDMEDWYEHSPATRGLSFEDCLFGRHKLERPRSVTDALRPAGRRVFGSWKDRHAAPQPTVLEDVHNEAEDRLEWGAAEDQDMDHDASAPPPIAAAPPLLPGQILAPPTPRLPSSSASPPSAAHVERPSRPSLLARPASGSSTSSAPTAAPASAACASVPSQASTSSSPLVAPTPASTTPSASTDRRGSLSPSATQLSSCSTPSAELSPPSVDPAPSQLAPPVSSVAAAEATRTPSAQKPAPAKEPIDPTPRPAEPSSKNFLWRWDSPKVRQTLGRKTFPSPSRRRSTTAFDSLPRGSTSHDDTRTTAFPGGEAALGSYVHKSTLQMREMVVERQRAQARLIAWSRDVGVQRSVQTSGWRLSAPWLKLVDMGHELRRQL